jgi:hypothetical protein
MPGVADPARAELEAVCSIVSEEEYQELCTKLSETD